MGVQAGAAAEVVRKARAGVVALEEEVARLVKLQEDKAKVVTSLRWQKEKESTYLAGLGKKLSGLQDQEQMKLQTLAVGKLIATTPSL